MKYFLRNISQSNILRTILSIVLGMFFWISSLIQIEPICEVLITSLFAICNAVLLSVVYSKLEVTNLPSPFVAITYWIGISAMPFFHSYWQGQVLIASVLVALLMLGNVGYRNQEAAEESFLSTLIVCIVSLVVCQALIGVLVIWIYLLSKRILTWRNWMASVIAIIVVVLYCGVSHYLGLITFSQILCDFFQQWDAWIEMALLVVISTITYLTIKRSSIASGIVYIMALIVLLTIGVVYLCFKW